jgi:hypothetical protein
VLSLCGVRSPAPFSGEKSVLFFTWIDRRSFLPDGSYQDAYFGPLPGFFQKNGYRVGFVPKILPTISFMEAAEKISRSGETFFFPEQFLSRSDLRASSLRQDRYTPDIRNIKPLGGLDIRPLLIEHIAETREFLLDNLLFEPLIRAMESRGISPGRILHTCEGHCWEQALSWVVHARMPRTKVVGYDNVTFSRMVLSMYPARSEMGIRPLPDRIVTNGPLFCDILTREGLPPAMVRAGCALRHGYLWKNVPVPAAEIPPGSPVRILVATAIGLGDSVELVTKAALAFGNDPRYEVIVKCHPLVDPGEVQRYACRGADLAGIRFENAPVSELLGSARILLYTYTSVCYEAMMYGVYPVCVKAENFLNLDKLDMDPSMRRMAATPQDLRAAAEQILAMTPEETGAWRARARSMVAMALAPVNGDCIRAFVDE